MKMRIKWMVAGWIMGMTWCLPQAWADTTWTNVPAGTAWEDAANWNKGVPSGVACLRADVTSNGIAQLTNKTCSYTVNYNVPANTFNELNIINTSPFLTTLNVNTSAFTQVGNWEADPLQLFLYSGIINVNSGGVVSAANNFMLNGRATLNVKQGGAITWGHAFKVNDGAVTIQGSMIGGPDSYAATAEDGNLSIVTIDGGYFSCGGFVVCRNSSSGTLNITNNGVFSSGALSVGSQGDSSANYGAKLNVSSGVLTNKNVLNIALIPSLSSITGNAEINISGGRFIQSGITTVGVARNGAINISGSGLFSTTNTVYVGGTTVPTLSGSATASGIINLTGGQLTVTNDSGTATLFVGNAITGTVTLAGGTTTVDNLVATNVGLSVFSFTAGTLAVRVSSLMSNGTAFVVGNGTSSAILSLLGGTHSFSNGLAINTNAVFALSGTNAIGSATINGNVTLQTNAVFDCDFNQTTNDFVMVNGTVTLPTQATLQARALDSSIRTPILVLQATQLNGNTSGWNVPLVNGRHYRARVVGNQLMLHRVPIGTVFTVK